MVYSINGSLLALLNITRDKAPKYEFGVLLTVYEALCYTRVMPKAPHPEVTYYAKLDVHKRRKIAEARHKRIAKEERIRLKQLHWHRCGNCGLELEEIPFKGHTIFKCFSCGSVLLPEGALEHICGEEKKIIESLLDLFRF